MALIDSRIITPTTDARASIEPLRKTIKKRENKRLDYEQAQDRASKLQRKIGRSPKDDKALAKAEDDMARAQEVRHPYLTTGNSFNAYKTTPLGIQHCGLASSGDITTRSSSHIHHNTTTPILYGLDTEQALGPILHVPA